MSQVGRQESILTTGEIVAPASPPRPPGQLDSHLCPFRSFRQSPTPKIPRPKGLGTITALWPESFVLTGPRHFHL